MRVILSFEPATELPTWLVIVLFGVPFIGGLLLYIYKTRHARSWRKGIFPPNLKGTEDNFLEAYLALGAKLILMDYQNSKDKTIFINEYFNRYFKFANYNFGDSLLFSLKYPIRTETVTNWLKRQLDTPAERTQVIYFLTGLSLVNGTLKSGELNFLKRINTQLELKPENLSRIIAIYASYAKEKENQEVRKDKSNLPSKYDYEILGVSPSSSKEDIKHAYRKLAKKHHPDNFANSTQAHQKMAEEKFIQIQKAYEALIK